jgi:DNA-nicking Smr family endonuclease
MGASWPPPDAPARPAKGPKSSAGAPSVAKPSLTQNPFATALAGLKTAPKAAPRAATRPAQPKPPPDRRGTTRTTPDDDLRAYFQSIAGAETLAAPTKVHATPAAPKPLQPHEIYNDDKAALDEFHALIDGDDFEFHIADTSEFIEGFVDGLDRQILKKLRGGDYAVQAHLHIRGLTREEAKPEVKNFIEGSRRKGLKCVTIIHGRGNHSKDNIPVLKESLKVWLTKGSVGRGVLAFATAQPTDGGAGAVYVLLRKPT